MTAFSVIRGPAPFFCEAVGTSTAFQKMIYARFERREEKVNVVGL
jgi:hypothetical protein